MNPNLTNDPAYRRLLAEWQIWYNAQLRALLEFRGHAGGLPKVKPKK